jgi:hypothetical protein
MIALESQPELCACGCGQQTDIARTNSRRGGVRAGDRLKFIHNHDKRTYRAEDGLYLCRKCGGRFTEADLTRDRNKRGELQDIGYCRKCAKARNDWNKTTNRTQWKRWLLKSQLQKKYGITIEDYVEMYDQQGGRCAICGVPRKSRLDDNVERHEVLHVDHCHRTGKVRGLLCESCNHGLGRMKDDPSILRAAADYIELNQ